MKQIRMIGSALALIAGLGGASSALASWVTFDIEWTGFGSEINASATGFITFDDASLPQYLPEDEPISLPSPTRVSDLEVTITGASIGNGTLGLSDFSDMLFWAPSMLDLSKELIGQLVDNGSGGSCNFGNGECGDFNLFRAKANAPNGVWNFILEPAGADCGEGFDCGLQVTSMKPGEARIPEPATLALFGLGLAGIPFVRRRRTPA